MVTSKRKRPWALSTTLQTAIAAIVAGAALIGLIVLPIVTHTHG